MDDLKRALHIKNHAQFYVSIILLDVVNVPFVTGNFRVKWKFKNAAHVSIETDAKGEATIDWPMHNANSTTNTADNSLSRSQTRDSAIKGNKSTAYRDVIKVKKVAHEEQKGTTEAVRIRTHVATFNRLIHCPVAIPINIKTSILNASHIKFSIRQELHNQAGKVEDHKLGIVNVDLSEFVSEASLNLTRASKTQIRPKRYLLAESKTNALLRIHVQMEFIGGQKEFLTKRQYAIQKRKEEQAKAIETGSSKSEESRPSSGSFATSSSQAHLPVINGDIANGDTSMTRNSSHSSIASLSEQQPSSPARDQFSTSPSSALLGLNSNHSGQVSANDVIESIFSIPLSHHTHRLHHTSSRPQSARSASYRIASESTDKLARKRTSESPSRSPSKSFLSLPSITIAKHPSSRPASTRIDSTDNKQRPPRPISMKRITSHNHSEPNLPSKNRGQELGIAHIDTSRSQSDAVHSDSEKKTSPLKHTFTSTDSTSSLSEKSVRWNDSTDD